MSNVYKNAQAKITSAGSYDDMYESPTATTSIVKSVKLFNTHGSALDVDIKCMMLHRPRIMSGIKLMYWPVEALVY